MGENHLTKWEDVHDTTNRFVNEDGTPYQYAGHWSWTYFDNNMNYCLDCKENEWDWMAEYRKTSSNNVIPNGNGANTGDGLALFNGLTTISSVIGIAGLFLLKMNYHFKCNTYKK